MTLQVCAANDVKLYQPLLFSTERELGRTKKLTTLLSTHAFCRIAVL